MDDARSRLFERLRQLRIEVEVVPYPEAPTVEEGKGLRDLMAGTFDDDRTVVRRRCHSSYRALPP